MKPDLDQAAIDRVARRMAFDEFEQASGPDRQAYAARNWRKYLLKARNAIEAAFYTPETVMTAWEHSAIMREPRP